MLAIFHIKMQNKIAGRSNLEQKVQKSTTLISSGIEWKIAQCRLSSNKLLCYKLLISSHEAAKTPGSSALICIAFISALGISRNQDVLDFPFLCIEDTCKNFWKSKNI